MIGSGEIILLAAALSVDSLAVAMSGSVSAPRLKAGNVIKVVLILGLVQMLFFIAGYYAGDTVRTWVDRFGPYIGFCTLLYVAGSMIRESLSKESESSAHDFSSLWKIMLASIATSIDAIAVGASMGLAGTVTSDEVCRISAATFIATVLFSTVGMVCGSRIGRKFGKPAELAAGIVLLVIGIGILVK